MSHQQRQHPHHRSKSSSYNLRIIVIGNSGVGKSSIVTRFAESEFDGEMVGTVGINFKNKTLKMDDKTLHLQIWDTAGEERFWSITPAYCRKADGVILIYDITNTKTFDGIHFWKNKVLQYSPEGVEMVLMGNKLDMKNQRAISEDTGKEAAERIGSPFFEVSAMTGHNIDQAFQALAEAILKKKELFADTRSRSFPYRIPIEDESISVGNEGEGTEPTNTKSSCCVSTPQS